MAHDPFDDDDCAGEELDLESLQRETSRPERRALRIDFDAILQDSSLQEGVLEGDVDESEASPLLFDEFLSKKEQEALERARGGTPTLDRLAKDKGKSDHPPRPAKVTTAVDHGKLPMEPVVIKRRPGSRLTPVLFGLALLGAAVVFGAIVFLTRG